MRYFNVDLRWLVDGRLSWRRLSVLFRHLPRESATSLAVFGESATWDVAEHLLAAMIDHLAIANWQRAGRGSRPKPFYRPGREEDGKKTYKAKRTYTPDEMAALFAPREGGGPSEPPAAVTAIGPGTEP